MTRRGRTKSSKPPLRRRPCSYPVPCLVVDAGAPTPWDEGETMQYREVPWSADARAHYPELVQDLMDLGLLSGGCVILDGDTDLTPIPLLVDREATMVVEVSDHHRTPAMRLRTVLRNGFLVETRLRWETLPPWPERMQKARRLTDIDTEMTGHAARGRSVVIESGPPERVLARHRDHVLAVSREQVSSPVELTTVDDALNIWNAALAHDERVEQTWREMVDRCASPRRSWSPCCS